MIRLEDILPPLKDFFSKRDDVRVAIIFGSIVRGGLSLHDVDVAIEPTCGRADLLDLGGLVSGIAGLLGLSEDMIYIVDLSRINQILPRRIVGCSITVKGGVDDLRRIEGLAERYLDADIEVRLWVSLDPEPRIDRVIIASMIEEIRRNIDFLRSEILGRDPKSFSYKDILSLEMSVHRIIEAMLDVYRHMVSVRDTLHN